MSSPTLSMETVPGFTQVFTGALRGDACEVVGLDEFPRPVPVRRWRRTADTADRALLDHCAGSVLDIGCGPGRMSEELACTGFVVLGIDLVAEAVAQARERGVCALRRDVFCPLPGEGRWDTALLADGNIGIGGDPTALLARIAELLAPHGRAVVELDPPGSGNRSHQLRLASRWGTSRPFRWSVVGAEAIAGPATSAGLAVAETHAYDHRWWAVLTRRW